MSQTCPKCGFINRATNRFCSSCGDTLMPATNETTPNDAILASSKAPSEPTTYVVQTWDAPEAVVAPPTSAPSDTSTSILKPPAFLPYGGYASASSAAPVAPAPVSPDRGEVGTYAAYSPGAARKMETQKPQRSWLIPSLVGAALLVLVLVVAGGFLLLSPKKTTVGSGGITTSPQSGGSDADQIKAVINKSNDEQITAWRNLDTEVLKGTRTGQVLDENVEAVEELKRKGMYAVPANKSIEFGDIVVDGNKATAKTVEVWTVTFYSKSDNKVVLDTGPDTLRETYHMVKQDGKWLVSSLDIEQDSQPVPVPATPKSGDA